jgi:hypothetical protein
VYLSQYAKYVFIFYKAINLQKQIADDYQLALALASEEVCFGGLSSKL